MAKQVINIGSGQNEGDGGDTRLAFEKINSNFDELYAGGVQTLTLVGTTLAISGGNQVTLDNVFEGGLTADVTGSVFADDSTLLVDGVSGTIPWSVLSGTPATGVVIVSPDTGFSTDVNSPTVLDNTTNSTYVITGNGASVDIYADLGSGAYVGQVITFGDSWTASAGLRVKISGNIYDPSTLTASQRTLTGLGQTMNFVWDGTAWYYWT